MRLAALAIILLAVILAGCAGTPPAQSAASMPSPGLERTIAPSATHAPASTATATPTDTPPPAATLTPSTTPTPTHPLMIEVLRQGSYPGSDLVIEETLPANSAYTSAIVSYQSEGLKIYALLTIPQGEAPASGWPVIVFNHGFIPPDQYQTTVLYEAHVDTFARHGYIVLRPDYRGHGNSEGEPTSPYRSPAYTIDVLNAVASIKRHPAADPDRIGMWGHSMGGLITLRVMVITADVKAGVIWAGVVASYPDMFEYWWDRRDFGPTPIPTNARGNWRTDLNETYGSPEENPYFWDSISPSAYLADLSGPIQLHHATGDETVPVEISEAFYEDAQAQGAPVELNIYEGDDHNIIEHFDLAMLYSVMFFDEHVKGS